MKQLLRLLTPIIKNSNPHFYEDKYFFSDSQWDLQAIKQNFKDKLHIAQELFDKSLETLEFSAVTFDSLLELSSLNALSKNEKLADDYFKVKSKRLKKKFAA